MTVKLDDVEVLSDVSATGKERPWKDKKERTMKMAEAFQLAGLEGKAARMASCGNVLVFNVMELGYHLAHAQFCQVRLCPMCTWRRSLKIANQNRQIVELANERQKLRWIFLTLTVRNVEGKELKSAIDHMMKSWHRFIGYKAVQDAVVGWFRGLEITRNTKAKSKSFGTYHPHFHVLIAVRPSFFTHGYIKQSEWADMWQKALQVDYTPITHVEVVKARRTKKNLIEIATEVQNAISEQKAIFEVSKYPVKDDDIIKDFNSKDTPEVVRTLDTALNRKRLIAYGGILKDIKKELGLSDVEGDSTDLVHIDESKDDVAEEVEKVTAYWHYGLKEYVISR